MPPKGPEHQPPQDDAGMARWLGAQGVLDPEELPDAYSFVSPNTDESVPFAEAVRRLTSQDHARFKALSADVDREVGLYGAAVDAIGDWKNGAENTLVTSYDRVDWETLRYSAALKGRAANQMAVLPFMAQEGGADSLYRIEFQMPMEEARKILDEEGIEFRTLVPGKGKTQVLIFDPGTTMQPQIDRLAERLEVQYDYARGQGEFIGGDSRAAGKAAFDRIVAEYETRPGARRYRGALRRRPAIAGGGRPEDAGRSPAPAGAGLPGAGAATLQRVAREVIAPAVAAREAALGRR